jgi:hypothetical protein
MLFSFLGTWNPSYILRLVTLLIEDLVSLPKSGLCYTIVNYANRGDQDETKTLYYEKTR